MERIKLKADGTILLGEHVSCDGFSYESPFRVQTHIHSDHMVGFETSKSTQTILMSEETRELLCAIHNADLPYRTNIKAIGPGPYSTNGDQVELFPSNHMLGSSQVVVTCSDGYRIGYSSDIFWPIDEVIQVDELIVDSTYGDPANIREYGQQVVDSKLIELVTERLKAGRCCGIIGFNGRLQLALHIVANYLTCPIVVSPKAMPLVGVYREHGYAMPEVFASDSSEGIEILRNRELCFACITLPERRHLPWIDRFAKITLSACMGDGKDPLMDCQNGDCLLAFTDHADFPGTMAYIEATGAGKVWADSRAGNAKALAIAVRHQLGIESGVPVREKSLAWG